MSDIRICRNPLHMMQTSITNTSSMDTKGLLEANVFNQHYIRSNLLPNEGDVNCGSLPKYSKLRE